MNCLSSTNEPSGLKDSSEPWAQLWTSVVVTIANQAGTQPSMAAQATAVVGVALQLDAPSLNEPLLAFLATRAGITALCAAIVSRQQRASAAALARSARAARLLVGDADDAPGAAGVAK